MRIWRPFTFLAISVHLFSFYVSDTITHEVCDSETQFQCKENGRCIHKSFVCDGESDCLYGDRSDESENCTAKEPDLPSSNGCPDEMFKCSTIDHCIRAEWKCDGERDCLDASDELECECLNNTFGCYVRGIPLCLRDSTKCDGIGHCDNDEDERNCTIMNLRGDYFCTSGNYKCRSADECVKWNLVCDGIVDCQDGSDEEGLCHVNDCGHDHIPRLLKTPGSGLLKAPGLRKICEQECHESPDGGQCLCESGFRLASDGVHCLDEDECAEMLSAELHNSRKLAKLYDYGLMQICSQTCINLPGGFHCGCAEGYILDFDAYSCKARGVFSPDLYVVIGAEIRVFSLRGPGHRVSHYYTVYKSDDTQESIVDMDVSIASSTIFWIEEKSGKLKMKNGHNIATFKLNFAPSAISVDWASGNLLAATARKDPHDFNRSAAVFVFGMNEKNIADMRGDDTITPQAIELISEGLLTPISIAIYPQKGIMLVADGGSSNGTDSRILAANMDGSEVRTVVAENLLHPVDVIVDDVHEAVIWAGYNKAIDEAVVESVRIDGTQRGVLMSRKVNQFPIEPLSIAVFEGYLYVSDRTAREVRSWETTQISMYGGQNTLYGSQSVIKLEHRTGLGTIKIVHPVLQRPLEGGNRCKFARCSHACAMVPTSHLRIQDLVRRIPLAPRCLCPTNYRLSKDQKACEELPSPDEAASAKPVWRSTVSTPTSSSLSAIPAVSTAANSTVVKTATLGTSAESTTVSSTSTEKTSITTQNRASTSNTSTPVITNTMTTIDASVASTLATSATTTSRATTRSSTSVTTSSTQPHSMAFCVHPPKVENSVVKSAVAGRTESFRTGETVKYSCSAGYAVRHAGAGEDFEITCLWDGSWDSQPSMCVPTVANTPETASPATSSNFFARVLTRHGTWCGKSRCGVWGQCNRNLGDYVCVCLYGESTSNTDECLPPVNPSTVTMASSRSPSASPEVTSPLSHSTVALIVVAVLFFILTSFLCCKCMRKKRYSIDLRYFCSEKLQHASTYSRDGVEFKPCDSSFIANPNYSSSRQLQRLPKPTFDDDKNDSGILPSFCSNSFSSSASEENLNRFEGPFVSTPESEEDRLANSCPLLKETVCQDEDDVSVCGLTVGDDAKFGKLELLSGRLGNIFKMRKTESRECMLPRHKLSKSVL